MKLHDLRTGDVVHTRGNIKYIVIRPLETMVSRYGFMPFSSYNSDMTTEKNNQHGYDIMTVYRPTEAHECRFAFEGNIVFDRNENIGLQKFDVTEEFTVPDLAERINEIVDAVNELRGERK